MTIYFSYGLIAIGMSMYIFYTVRKKRKAVAADRRKELKDTRQSWLDHQLGKGSSEIILYDEFMEQKIRTLTKIGTDVNRRESYYIDPDTADKWLREHPYPEMQAGGAAQLRKVKLFPYEE